MPTLWRTGTSDKTGKTSQWVTQHRDQRQTDWSSGKDDWKWIRRGRYNRKREQTRITRRVHRCHYFVFKKVKTTLMSWNTEGNTNTGGKEHQYREHSGGTLSRKSSYRDKEKTPSMKELMEEAIEYRCSCRYGSYSQEKVMWHKEQKRHHNDIPVREVSFGNTRNETPLRRHNPWLIQTNNSGWPKWHRNYKGTSWKRRHGKRTKGEHSREDQLSQESAGKSVNPKSRKNLCQYEIQKQRHDRKSHLNPQYQNYC